MKKKELLENNEIVAEFMGATFYPFSMLWNIPYIKQEVTSDSLNYHSSWDWLMPVVEKISTIKLGFGRMNTKIVTLSREPYCRMDSKGKSFRNSAGYGHNNTLLEATYKTVVEFIEWYNKIGI